MFNNQIKEARLFSPEEIENVLAHARDYLLVEAGFENRVATGHRAMSARSIEQAVSRSLLHIISTRAQELCEAVKMPACPDRRKRKSTAAVGVVSSPPPWA
jgi:hypothetical protein